MRIEHNSDRRVFDRFTTSLPVRFSSEMLDFDAEAELEQGSVENISCGGLFVRSEFLEVPGTPITGALLDQSTVHRLSQLA